MSSEMVTTEVREGSLIRLPTAIEVAKDEARLEERIRTQMRHYLKSSEWRD
jgi:hypothetical protein